MMSLKFYVDSIIRQVLLCLGLCAVLVKCLPQTELEAQQYCQTEVFEAACPLQNEIIMVEEAKYGRMEIGKCVRKDYGNVGCHVDVLRETDRRCSGKRICRITIPDSTFDKKEPCPLEFKTYFQVKFRCLQIIVPDNAPSCSGNAILNIGGTSGYLSSTTTQDKGYGSKSCPWKISLPHGQRINITLIDFKTPGYDPEKSEESSKGLSTRDDDRNRLHSTGPDEVDEDDCPYPYAILKESSPSRTVKVCGGSDRERNVFLSKSNGVEVQLIASNAAQFGDENFFVLKYEAVGCENPQPPQYGLVVWDSVGRANMQCNFSDLKWQLECVQRTWVGENHSCPPQPPNPRGDTAAPDQGIVSEQRKGNSADVDDDDDDRRNPTSSASFSSPSLVRLLQQLLLIAISWIFSCH